MGTEPGRQEQVETDDSATWITILGSCVSRDTLETMPRDAYPIDGYYARYSLLSAGTDATPNIPEDFTTSSKFQRRNVVRDIKGNLLEELQAKTKSEVFLWDLVDERHGVYEFPDGTVITRSIDVINIPEIAEAVKGARHLEFGEDEHFYRWSGAAAMFADALDAFGLREKALVIATDWAEHDIEGNTTPWSMGKAAPQANRLFARYYDRLEQLGFRVLRMHNLLADPGHRWGLAPFHYEPSVYAKVRAAIESFPSA
ncbi:DUF6270 domain-containing protein [Gulosibacter faecalis]|jgi:hypothetical protein|uniref:DUF6270 domain-containing protein n=1 Tax=Gulosibacter faecalis TaxID=272240 RepID=A0ABW5UVH9_9MICO|nr:DUF6270 domain-containing protein [Gulosibacter faecalis]